MRRLLLALILFAAASAQQPPAPPPPPAPVNNAPGTNTSGGSGDKGFTFTTGTNLVVEEITVLDKNGKPVPNLTKDDFKVTEDGVPQTVTYLEYNNLPDTPGPQLQTRNDTVAQTDTQHGVAPLDKLTRTEITPEPPGQLRYRDRRLLALYFDMTAMPQSDQLRALSAAETFIAKTMTAEDLMCIMRYNGSSVDVLSEFTDDKDKLQSILETIIVGEDQGLGNTQSDAASSDTGAAFGQDDSEFNIFTTDRQLAALQTAAKMLGRLNEKKVLVYFASGMQLNGVDNQAQLHATENAALRNGVQFWTIDSRGLVATPPMGDASQRTASSANLFNGATAGAFVSRLQQSQDTMYALATDTGGKAFLDNNDLGKGIQNAERSIGSYYILGYNTTNTKLDGKFRRIKITVGEGLTAKLSREGYFGDKDYKKFNTVDKERQLEDALMAGDPVTDLTIAMELDFFQINGAEYFVPVTVKIPGRELALARRGGAEHTTLDFIGEVKDDYGTTLQNIRDFADVKFGEATAQELSKRPFVYSTSFTVLPSTPGKYHIKFLARDAETGRIGTYEQAFVIPNLMKEDRRVPTSAVVLSSQREDLKDAVFNALKTKDRNEKDNPLVVDGQKMIPSVTRVFSKSKDMYVFLEAYQPKADTPSPKVAYVTLYKGQTTAFQTPLIQVTTPINVTGRNSQLLKIMPFHFTVPLASLQPGQYDCQVTVLDPNDNKASFWQAPIEVIQ